MKLCRLRSHLTEDALSLRQELLLLQATVPSWASLLSAIMVVTTASYLPPSYDQHTGFRAPSS